MTLLKRIWKGEDENVEVKTAYQYVVDLRERIIEEPCELAKNELAKVQARNQKYYNRRTRERKFHTGDSVVDVAYRAEQVNFALARYIQTYKV